MTTPQVAVPLKPCPGCAKSSTRVIGGPGTSGGPKYWAGCDHCNWRTWGDTQAEAITAWNTRSHTTEADEVARLTIDDIEGLIVGQPSPRLAAEAILTALKAQEAPADVALLVERLGHIASWLDMSAGPTRPEAAVREAADLITRLSADLAEARKVIEPFADLADYIMTERPEFDGHAHEVQIENWPYTLSVGWLRRARHWLSQQGDQS